MAAASIFKGRSTHINFYVPSAIEDADQATSRLTAYPDLPTAADIAVVDPAPSDRPVSSAWTDLICSWLVCVALGEESFRLFNSMGSTLVGKIFSWGLYSAWFITFLTVFAILYGTLVMVSS
ncbi:MAG: hypothetical protein CM1200mP39_29430 [Dehalococcoidia bacterium]|nr:MAG: hypothetical protein CM1200mP39_29430 [Dehalococcoidia bacterium]